MGIYAHPIFSEAGGWPQVVVDRVAARSTQQGFPRSRLPQFTPEEIDYIRGTADLFGLNHYSTYYVYRNESTLNKYPQPSYKDDLGVVQYQLEEWSYTKGDFVAVCVTLYNFALLLSPIHLILLNVRMYIVRSQKYCNRI